MQKEITLIPTFLSSKGEVVQGAAAKVVLPGRTSPVSTGKSPIQTVVYEEKSIPTAEGPLPQLGAVNPQQSGGMKTTTIQVPGNLMRPRVSSASIEKANAILQSQAAQLPSNNQPRPGNKLGLKPWPMHSSRLSRFPNVPCNRLRTGRPTRCLRPVTW